MGFWQTWRKPRRVLNPEIKASRAVVAMHSVGRPLWTPRDYEALAREGFGRNAIAYRCIRMIAEAAASVALEVRAEGRHIPTHPLQRLLDRPNPEQSGTEVLETLYGHLQTTGNAYLEAVEVSGPPDELYALRPDRMQVIPGPNGWPMGYSYGVEGRATPFMRDPETGFMPVMHLKLFHPAHDHYGFSPLEAAAYAIDIHNAAGAWNKALLDNAARPSGALVYSGREGNERLTDEQFERLKHELAGAHTGPDNAGRPLVLDGGLDWKPMSLSPAEMDFIEAKNGAARDIALAFGVPPMLLGIPGDNTYSNYREAHVSLWRQTVLPLVEKTARALSNWLGPRFGHAVVVPDIDRVPALAVERDLLWGRLTAATFITDAEKRRLAGLDMCDEI